MAKPDFSGLTTFIPIAVQGISELIKAKVFEQADLSKEITIMSNIEFQKKVGFLGQMDDIGMKRTVGACAFNTIDAQMATTEKTWTPMPWDTKLVYCADDYANTIGEIALQKGIDQFDMTNPSNELMQVIIDFLYPNIVRMYNRFIWMSDSTAAHTDDSPAGNITPTVDLKLINIADGLWKKAIAIWAAAPAQKITIAANAEATYALQKSALTPALALSYANSLYYDAPAVIREAMTMPGWYFKCTQSFFDKLAQNFQGVGATQGLESMRVSLENGLKGISINGIPFVPDPTQDAMIQKYNDNGTSWYKPHRVVLMHKENAVFGTPDSATWGNFKMHFSDDDDKVYIKLADKFDTMWLHDNLVMGAI